MAKRRFSKRSKKSTYRKRRGGVRRRTSTKKFKRAVRTQLRRAAETKSSQRFNLGQNLVPSNATTFAANIIELGPGVTMPIAQGTGQGNRVGNRIETVRHVFKGTIVPYPQDSTTNPNPQPLVVKMWIFYDKTDPTAVPNPITYPFFQDGNGVAGFSNDLIDTWRPVNTDRYRVLCARTFKLGFSEYAGTAASTLNQGQYQAYSNNDFKLNCGFRINLTKYQIKKIRFNDANNEPMTRRMFCMWQPVAASGIQMTSTWIPCGVQYMEDYKYKDI